jgi:four helix bundle protein
MLERPRTSLPFDLVFGAIPFGSASALLFGMPATNSFRDLQVWQEAMTLVEEIYSVSNRFPPDERFGLTMQIRKAAVSIPSNIGEGARRKRRKAYLHHLDISLGSQGEVEVQLEVAKRVKYCDVAEYMRIQPRVERVGRMLNGLIASLQPTDDDWA